jgi:hypothetical protein
VSRDGGGGAAKQKQNTANRQSDTRTAYRSGNKTVLALGNVADRQHGAERRGARLIWRRDVMKQLKTT